MKMIYHNLCADKTDMQCFQGCVWPKKMFSQATSGILRGDVHAFQPFLAELVSPCTGGCLVP